jgi:hypothetical protein
MQMGLAGGIAPQEDGKHWLIVTWQLDTSAQFTFKIPPEAAAQLAEHFPKFIADLIQQAKRADSGIIVGGPDVLDLAKKAFEDRGVGR